jgi:epoxyqueuosine reductase
MHGEMDYMASHGMKRARPAELVPGTVRVISARMDYLPQSLDEDWRETERRRLADPGAAVISVYARGRDYHKVLRARLQQLADRVRAAAGEFGYRVFTDSAPVMELPLAEKSGLGWRGKHTLLINRSAGSMFFMGEIMVDLPLPVDAPTERALRPVLGMHRCLPHAGDPRPRQAGCAALHLLPHDRAQGQQFLKSCGP